MPTHRFDQHVKLSFLGLLPAVILGLLPAVMFLGQAALEKNITQTARIPRPTVMLRMLSLLRQEFLG